MIDPFDPFAPELAELDEAEPHPSRIRHVRHAKATNKDRGQRNARQLLPICTPPLNGMDHIPSARATTSDSHRDSREDRRLTITRAGVGKWGGMEFSVRPSHVGSDPCISSMRLSSGSAPARKTGPLSRLLTGAVHGTPVAEADAIARRHTFCCAGGCGW